MSITFHCGCGKGYRVDDDKGGRKLKCRACGEILTIPRAKAASGPVQRKPTQKERPDRDEEEWDDEGWDDDSDDSEWGESEWDEEEWDEEDEWEEPAPKPSKSGKAGQKSKATKRRTSDEDDLEPDEDESPAWHNFVWAGGLFVAAIVAFFYLRWMKAQGDEFTGEGGRGLERFLAFAYSIGGEWAVAGVLLALAGFFAWCGYTEWQDQEPKKASTKRRGGKRR